MPRTLPFLACLLLSFGAAANAQTTTTPSNVVVPTPTPREGTVGPEQLRDFSLPGTRTTTAPATNDNAPAPAPRATAPATSPTPRPAPTERPATTASPTETSRAPAPTARPAETTASPTVERSAPVAVPSTAPVDQGTILPTPALPSADLGVPSTSLPVSTSLPTPTATEAPSSNWWAWLIAAALAGGAIALLFRQRRRRSTAGGYEEPVAPYAEPAPKPVQPVRPLERAALQPAPAPSPAPAPAPAPAPTGIVYTRLRAAPAAPVTAPAAPEPAVPVGAVVSTRLRSWIDLDLAMREIVIDSSEAILRFDLAIINGGAAAARDVIVEALAFNAGEQQSEELQKFFAQRAGSTDGIPEMAPMGSAVVSHEIRMPRAAIRAYEAQGRTLFVPIIAFNASYRAGATTGRTSAAWLLGREMPGSERLAPLLLGEGSSRLLGLGVRRLEDSVRR